MHADPIYCYRPTPERAAEFAAPAYDVFDRAGAAAYVEAHPRSFLAIDRPETGFAPDHDMYAADVYEHARDLLNERVADGTLLRDEKPCYYVWRLATAESHTQTGIVAGVAVDDYEDGTVHRHEDVLKAKAQDRINHIRTTNAQTGPIFLAYRDDPTIDSLVALTTTGEPLYDFTAEDGCRHTIWRISREVAVQSLQLMFDRQVPDAYIADGHHRCASAVAVDAIEFMTVEAKPNQHYRYGNECPVGTAFPHLSHLAVGFQHVAFITDNVYMGAMVCYSVGYCQ